MTPERYIEIRALADRLVADCNGGEQDDLDMIEDMSRKECMALDGIAFKCAGCDQWFDVHEMREPDTFVCTGCGPDE